MEEAKIEKRREVEFTFETIASQQPFVLWRFFLDLKMEGVNRINGCFPFMEK